MLEYIDAHLGETVSLDALARVAGLSLYHFCRAFKRSKGVSPHGYLIQRRVERVMKLIAGTNLPPAATSLGAFANTSVFAHANIDGQLDEPLAMVMLLMTCMTEENQLVYRLGLNCGPIENADDTISLLPRLRKLAQGLSSKSKNIQEKCASNSEAATWMTRGCFGEKGGAAF